MPTRRAPAKKANVRTRAASPDIQVAPRIMSDEEKHQLILAHSRARKPVDQGQRASVWVGAAVCIIFIAGAWMMTIGSTLKKAMAGPMNEAFSTSLDLTKQFAEGTTADAVGATNDIATQLANISSQLDTLKAQQDVVDSIAAQINSTSTVSTTSTQLFKPTSTSTATTTTTQP